MSGTAKIKCDCEHAQQDQMHGKGVRIGNLTGKGNYRCTVCGSIREGHAAPSMPVRQRGKK
jgi:hypothetical protein